MKQRAWGIPFVLLVANVMIVSGCDSDASQRPRGEYWIGDYTCLVDDTTEVYDGDRSAGHTTFDLDRDQSDAPARIRLEVHPETVKLQQVIDGRPTQAMMELGIAQSMGTRILRSLIAVGIEPGTGRGWVLAFMQDQQTHKYGFSLTASSYAMPAMPNGESFATVDVQLAHCTKL